MNIEKMLAECRAQWEASSGGSVFADYWLGWQASRQSLVIELPQRYESDYGTGYYADDEGDLYQVSDIVEAIEAAGVRVAK